MEEKEMREKLEKFECRRCNECCRKPGFVYLKEGEEEKIAGFLGLEIFDFVNRFCELVDRRRLVLKKHPDEACIFLKESGCSIHPAKPQQCLDFPVKWRTPASFEYCQGLKLKSGEKEPKKVLRLKHKVAQKSAKKIGKRDLT